MFNMSAEHRRPPRNLACQKSNQNRADKNKKDMEKNEGFEYQSLSENQMRQGHRLLTNAKQQLQELQQEFDKFLISQSQEKLEAQRSLESVSETFQQEREQLQFQVKAMKTAFRELCVAKERQVISLQNNCGRLEEEMENLQVKLEDLEHESTEQQNKLKKTVEEQSEVIRTLKADLIRSNEERECLTVQLQENKVFAEEYRNIMKEMERRHSLKKNKNSNPKMHKLICHNTVLMEKLNQSKILIDTEKAHSKQLQTRCQQLQTYIRRFEEDLQACTSVITEPKELKQKVATLKSTYLDNRKTDHSLDNFETEYQSQIRALEQKIARLMQIKKNDQTIRKRMEQKHSAAVSTFTKREKEYIRLLQVEIYKNKLLEKELKKANLTADHAHMTPLENSTRSACSSITTEVDGEMVQFNKWDYDLSEPPNPGETDKGNTESLTSHQMCGTSASENSVEG